MTISEAEIRDLASGSSSRLQLWNKILTAANATTMAEIGVWKGEFAKQILEQCDFINRYYLVDPWATLPDWNKPFNVEPKVFDEIYADAMRNTAFASGKTVVLRGRTKEVVDQIPDNSLDFAYIDGDHTLRGITIDLISLFPKIKMGGLLGGDDFTNTHWQHGVSFEPTLVCPLSIYFAEAMNCPFFALPFNQFLMKKTAGDEFLFIDIAGKYGDVSLNKLAGVDIPKSMRQKLRHMFGKIGLTKT